MPDDALYLVVYNHTSLGKWLFSTMKFVVCLTHGIHLLIITSFSLDQADIMFARLRRFKLKNPKTI